MNRNPHSVEDAAKKIRSGKCLLIAGEERLLAGLPPGYWIAGTTPYVMAESGGQVMRDRVFVTELPSYLSGVEIKVYRPDSIHRIYEDAPENGFSVIIAPAGCETHLRFALNAPKFPGFASRVLIGWIAGVFLPEIGKTVPKVFDGRTAGPLADAAVVMHASLPPRLIANVEILNIFEQSDADAISFPENGFRVRDAIVNGGRVNFLQYLKDRNTDTRLPLVADYFGVSVNSSFQLLHEETGSVQFYAPVFKGIQYKLAKPVSDYVRAFQERVPEDLNRRVVFSCNCILNYLYSELEAKRTGGFTGPFTFGEVAYQLLNQTMVYLTIDEI